MTVSSSVKALPTLAPDDPHEIVRNYFKKAYPRIAKKIELQVRRTPRRQTGLYKTNRECRWALDPKHPDYTAAAQIKPIEAKLMSQALSFEHAPGIPVEVQAAAAKILGHDLVIGAYRCPVSGKSMDFAALYQEADKPTHGRSKFQVGHVRPKARGGVNDPDNTYWISDLGNRIQGDNTWQDTVKTIVEMAEFQRKERHGDISWNELVNRYLD
jgi:hypothetical protein